MDISAVLIITIVIIILIIKINKPKNKPLSRETLQNTKKPLSRETLQNINKNRYSIKINDSYSEKKSLYSTKTQRFKTLIPKGYRIYFDRVEVAGTYFKKDNIIDAFSNDKIEISFEEEPTNQYDKNALKVIITNSANKKFHIGYVPKEIAKLIQKSKLLNCILPRLKYINFKNIDNIIVEFDILGLKTEYSKHIK